MSERINSILSVIGRPGKYQLLTLLWGGLVCLFCSLQTLVIVFTQSSIDFRCADRGNFNNDGGNASDKCLAANDSKVCLAFNYSTDVFESTTFSEFNLVCSRQWLPMVTNILFMAARVPCGTVAGILMDKFGRKKPIIVLVGLAGATGLGAAFSSSMEMYIIFRVVISLLIMASYDCVAALLVEVTAPDRRPHINISMAMFWGVGVMLLSPLAYWLRNWRHLQIAVSIPAFPIAIILIWAINESPHWLVGKGNYSEAQKIINKMAIVNKKNIACDLTINPADEAQTVDGDKFQIDDRNGSERIHDNWAGLFKARRLLSYVMIASFGWLATNLVYTGLAFTVGGLAGSIYLNNFFGGAAEIASYSICYIVIFTGRRKACISLLIVGGLALISHALVLLYTADTLPAVIITNMVGKLCVTAAWQIMYIWCLEIYPTTMRLTLFAASFLVGHIGSAIAPLITDFDKVSHLIVRTEIMSPVLFGVLMVLAGGSAVFLPETNKRTLPVTIADANKLE